MRKKKKKPGQRERKSCKSKMEDREGGKWGTENCSGPGERGRERGEDSKGEKSNARAEKAGTRKHGPERMVGRWGVGSV